MSREFAVWAAMVALVITTSLGIVDIAAPADGQMSVAVGNTAKRVKSEWEWTIFLMADDRTLNDIECVTYLLHPSFTQRIVRRCEKGTLPGKGFLMTATGWGTFTVGITIQPRNGREFSVTHDLTFKVQADGWAVLPGDKTGTNVAIPVTAAKLKDGHFVFDFRLAPGNDGRMTLTSLDIRVLEDGHVGSGKWEFQIFANEEPWFGVPERKYSNESPPIRIPAAALKGSLALPNTRDGRDVAIRVRGSQ